jgi:hypothetical protein
VEAGVIRPENQSSEELKSRFAFVFAPSRQRDTAHRPIRTGRPRARRRFGYWGEQIGQSAGSEWSPFRCAPAELEPATAVSASRRCRMSSAPRPLWRWKPSRTAERSPLSGSDDIAPTTIRPYDRQCLVQVYDLPFKIISAVIRSSSAKPTDFQTVMSVSARLKSN